MTRLIATCAAALFALAALPGFAADLTSDERSELRQRADALNSRRASNPSWDGGTLYSVRSDVPLDRPRGDMKTPRGGDVKVKPGKTRAKKEPVTRKLKRSAKNAPGALVRERRRCGERPV